MLSTGRRNPRKHPANLKTSSTLVALAFVVVFLTGSSADRQASDPTAQPPEAARPSTSAIVGVAATLDSLRDQSVQACMTSRGFPQLAQVAGSAMTPLAEGDHHPLRFDPLEFGPYTEDQAKRYGLVGTVYAFSGGDPSTKVVYENAFFDRALAECGQAFDRSAQTDVVALQVQLAQLLGNLRAELMTATEPQIYRLLRERLACVQDSTHPALDPNRVLAAESFEKTLRILGIPAGQIHEAGPHRTDLEPGEIAVVQAPSPPQYVPSDEEVELALSYVRCGQAIAFLPRVAEVQRSVKADIVAAHAAELAGIDRSLRSALDNAANA